MLRRKSFHHRVQSALKNVVVTLVKSVTVCHDGTETEGKIKLIPFPNRNNFVCIRISGVEVRHLHVDWLKSMTTAIAFTGVSQ